MKLESETTREIISDHAFYALIIIGITISIYHQLPIEIWKESWNLIVFLCSCGLVLDVVSFAKSFRLKKVIEDYNSSSNIVDENPFDEVDKESERVSTK